MINFSRGKSYEADSGETVYVSSLALLKMLRHGRDGIPLEVMGLILGEYIDPFTIELYDVFAMPQSGTGVTVEAVDPIYQTKFMDLLSRIDRHDNVIGWYHSHPGFGCWLSSIDVSTQQDFERLNKKAIALVVDPVQSVKGKVVLDIFRCISNEAMMTNAESRSVTSSICYKKKPTLVSLLHGLDRSYYGLQIKYRKKEADLKLLMNLNRKNWFDILKIKKRNPENNKKVRNLTNNFITKTERCKNAKPEIKDIIEMEKGELKVALKTETNKLMEDTVLNQLVENIHRYIFLGK